MALKTDRLEPQAFLAHAFFHEYGIHWAASLFTFFVAGMVLEPRWGLLRFGAFFVYVTLGSALISLAAERIRGALIPEAGGAWVFGGAAVALAALAAWSQAEEGRWKPWGIPRKHAIWCAVLLGSTGLLFLERTDGEPRIFLICQISGIFFGWSFTRILPRLDGYVLRREQRRRKEEEDEVLQIRNRVDLLLEKISVKGFHSLSDEERAFLEQASKHYRRQV
jgi:membrane associated rhomboid family serine protease